MVRTGCARLALVLTCVITALCHASEPNAAQISHQQNAGADIETVKAGIQQIQPGMQSQEVSSLLSLHKAARLKGSWATGAYDQSTFRVGKDHMLTVTRAHIGGRWQLLRAVLKQGNRVIASYSAKD